MGFRFVNFGLRFVKRPRIVRSVPKTESSFCKTRFVGLSSVRDNAKAAPTPPTGVRLIATPYAENIGHRVFTIGHSTRHLDEFIAMLRSQGVDRLIDVRTVPRSRTNPQFNRDTLPDALARQDIAYEHEPRLGGLRHAHRDSPNAGWKNASFRGYADHMATPEFRAAIDHVIGLADSVTPVLMCAEAVPWRCHRSLIADALTARGIGVAHIMSAQKTQPHRMTSFARVEDGAITYPELPGGGETFA